MTSQPDSKHTISRAWCYIQNHPKRSVFALFLFAFLLTCVRAYTQLIAVRNKELKLREYLVELQALNLNKDKAIVSGSDQAEFLRRSAENLRAYCESHPTDADLREAYNSRQDLIWQLKVPSDNGSIYGLGLESLAGISVAHRVDEHLYKDLATAREMGRLLALGMQTHSYWSHAYFVSAKKRLEHIS